MATSNPEGITYSPSKQDLTINLDVLNLPPQPGEPLRYTARLAEIDRPILVRKIIIEGSNIPPHLYPSVGR